MKKIFITLMLLTASGLCMACQCTDQGLDEYDVADTLTKNVSTVGEVDPSSIKVISSTVRENYLLLIHGLILLDRLESYEDRCAVDCSYGRRMVEKVKFSNKNSLDCSATLVKPANKFYQIKILKHKCQ